VDHLFAVFFVMIDTTALNIQQMIMNRHFRYWVV